MAIPIFALLITDLFISIKLFSPIENALSDICCKNFSFTSISEKDVSMPSPWIFKKREFFISPLEKSRVYTI